MGPCPFLSFHSLNTLKIAFLSSAPSPPEGCSIPAPAGEAAGRNTIRFVSVKTTVERISKNGDNLGFDILFFEVKLSLAKYDRLIMQIIYMSKIGESVSEYGQAT